MSVLNALLSGQSGVKWMHCRLMVMGAGNVGKTSCLNALSGKPFERECKSTVGAQVCCRR